MAERIKVYLKCCCGSEISLDTDEYKRTWLDEQLGKFTALHQDCPENLTRKLTETYVGFKPGLYATNAPVANSGPDNFNPPFSESSNPPCITERVAAMEGRFWTDPAGKKIPY